MEKMIQVSIGGAQFQIAEEAYAMLEQYLASIRTHFQNDAEQGEIIRDIESRIAEKLLERKPGVVSKADIARIIEEIGSATQFDQQAEQPASGPRRFYRDLDNAIFAGVASGLGAYFNIDPLYVRLAFIASIFFGGTGGILYLVLALLVPPARNAGQKLEMRGQHVSVDSITRTVRESVDRARSTGALDRLANAIGKIVRALVRIVGVLASVILSVGSFLAILALTLGFAMLVANWKAPYVGSAFQEVVSPALLWIGALSAYFAAVIPLILIAAFAMRLRSGRSALASTVGFGLIGAWCLSVIVLGAVGSRVAADYYRYTAETPTYQRTTDVREVAAFSTISVSRASVTIRSGDEQRVEVIGTSSSTARIHTSVDSGELAISMDASDDPCIFFCKRDYPRVVITVPDVRSISADSASVDLENLEAPMLDLSAKHASLSGTLHVPRLSITEEFSNVRLEGAMERLTLSAKNSSADLEGDGGNMNVTARNSSINARSLIADTAIVSAYQSYVEVFARESLQRADDIESSVVNAARVQE